ncbi:transcriptional regulator family: Fungal Specific TF [Paecilomyces variotii]|nr:transcriptional regulator family: Fungal Specific TF [Paecilomyces variotii]
MSSTSYQPSTAGSNVPATTSATPISELPQSQVDAIIRTKRKAREPKACYPCHTRKVKCDRNLPCDGCVKRDHADLCSYERPSKKRQVAATVSQTFLEGGTPAAAGAGASGVVGGLNGTAPVHPSIETPTAGAGGGIGVPGRVSIPREEWENVCSKLKEMEQTISSLRTGLEQVDDGGRVPTATSSARNGETGTRSEVVSPDGEGIHAANTLGEGTVHLGSRSVLAYILNRSGSSQAQALLEGGILPKLGLDNESATYPFVDLWSSDTSFFDVNALCGALPSDQQCKEFLYFYRDIGGTIYPVLADVVEFEEKLNMLLHNRSAAGGVYKSNDNQSQRPFGVSLAYIGLLFAVLASGCQSSDLPSKERELTSQVYVCCSYQCLRMTNFLSQPTIEAIQTLLIIGNVLSYNMNPGVSYVLLGMTLRMGLSLGLHVESNRFSPRERYVRRHVWWSMAWQDSHFSLSYDRPSTTAVGQPDIAYRPNSKPGDRSYFETLCRIISLTLEVVKGRMLAPHFQMNFKTIRAYKERIQQILTDATPHLRDRKYCLTSKDHLECLQLKLHVSYITSELCRPAVKPTADTKDPATATMRRDCVDSLMMTVQSYIELHSVNSHAARSWISLQRAISCAFLLAVIEESKSDSHVWTLLRQLEVIIADRAIAEGVYDPNETPTGRTSVTSPPQAMATTVQQNSHFNTIPGVTNTPISNLDSVSASASASATTAVPASVAADTQTQWAKPLTKSLRALQKLNAAFNNLGSPSGGAGNGFLGPPNANPAAAGLAGYQQTGSASTMTPSVGSLPPPTPESSTSGEWTIPNILDRASEYIHPPLWG